MHGGPDQMLKMDGLSIEEKWRIINDEVKFLFLEMVSRYHPVYLIIFHYKLFQTYVL